MTIFIYITFILLGFGMGYFVNEIKHYIDDTKQLNQMENYYNQGMSIVTQMSSILENIVENSKEKKEEHNEEKTDGQNS